MDTERDVEMLERWVSAHQQTVYRAAYLVVRDAAVAEDVAQETFLRAYRAAHRLEPGDDIRGWLYRIATNTALNHLRSLRRQRAAYARLDDPAPEPDPAEAGAVRDAVADGLRRLPDRLRVPVVLRYYVDLPEKEIARLLHIRPGTVKSRLHEARRLLAADDELVAAARGTG